MKGLALALCLLAARALSASCVSGTDIFCPLDNSTTSTCGNNMTWSGTPSYTTSNAPSPNTYWAALSAANYVYASSTAMSATQGMVQYVFRTGSDVTTTQFVSSARATGTGAYRWLDIYITAGGLNFYNATPSLAGGLGAVSTNTTYYIQVNWSASGVRIYKGTSTTLSQVYTSGSSVLSTSPTLYGFYIGHSPDLALDTTGMNVGQYRQSTTAGSGTWIVEGADTPTPTPNWTATPTPTISPTQVPCNTPVVRVQQFGDSFQLGVDCDKAETGNISVAARADFINAMTYWYGRTTSMVSSTGDYGGYLCNNKTQAVSGQTTTVQLSLFSAQLDSGLTAPNSRLDVVWLGGGTAGQILGETAATISSNWNAMMDIVYAKSPAILIVLVNPAWNPSYSRSVTNEAWNTSMGYARGKGYRVVGYDPYPTLGENTSYICADNLHPTHGAQMIVGQQMAIVVNNALSDSGTLSPYTNQPQSRFITPTWWGM